ncbi:phenylalanine--tRNA ligase subunit alpha [bacterium]|nr:phenylalanine--tRNA ligase subunit alpha [bacterium]
MDDLNKNKKGHLHPMTQMINEINSIFSDMGFEFADGPEMESEYYNFDALNFEKNHPARDMQDTFWVKDKENTVMRTHTSNVQIRYMENNKPPIRIIVPGKVFRNEATDATHEAQFYQFEGLMVDETTTLGTLKGVLKTFLEKFFSKDVEIRLRPSYFPFVEPGIEVDMSCFSCEGKGCSICKSTGWIEVLGAGMVHPNVLKAGGIDSEKYQGFAFGVGIDRLAMLKYGIDDVRLLYQGDLRFVNQF